MSWEELQRINKELYNASWGLDKFGENSSQGKFILSQIESLKRQKANLPPEILRREQVEIMTEKLVSAVKSEMIIGNGHRVESYRQSLQELEVPDKDIQKIIDSTRDSYRDTAKSKVIDALKHKLEESLRDHYDNTGQALRIDVQGIIDGDDKSETKIGKYVRRAVQLGLEIATLQAQIDDVLQLSEDDKQAKLNKLTAGVREYLKAIEFKAELDPSYTVPDDMVKEIESWESNDDIELTRSQTDVLRAKRELAIHGVSDEVIVMAIGQGSN